MDRSLSPPAARTRSKAPPENVLPTATPVNNTPTAATPTRAGFYDLLRDQENSDEDNPFRVDLEDEDGLNSPILLSAPAGDTVVATTVGSTDTPATMGDLAEGTVAAATGTNTTASPPNALLPATTAAITRAVVAILEANIGTAIEAALKQQLSSMHAEMASNHGHVTKRLYP
jgi:hypothetical protein